MYVTTDHTPLYCKVPAIIPKKPEKNEKVLQTLGDKT
jgi:hypothetical protein